MNRLLATTALLSLPGLVAAEEPVDLGTLILTANQTPVDSERSGVTVETLSEEDLTDNGTTQVVDQLRDLPGVFVAGNGPIGSLQSVYVRGRPFRYVPVYFDGIDLGDPSSVQTGFNWGGLVTPGLGRVEILKGAQSAVYGSEAVGGVVNLSSARLDEPGREIRTAVEFGSYNTFSTSLTYLQKTERTDLTFTLSHYQTDGFSAADENDGNTEADGYEGNAMSLRVEYQATDALRFGGTFFIHDEKIEIDGFPPPTFSFGDVDQVTTSVRKGARVFATFDAGGFEHTLSVIHTDIDRKDPDGITTRFEGTRTEIEYAAVTELEAGTLSFGLANSTEAARLSNGTKNEFDIASAWIEGQFALSSDVDMTVSARFEDHSEFGSASTGRLALAWRATDATTVRFSAGTGFRAPSLYELFGPFGNTSLEAEESVSVDLGVQHRYVNGADIKATVFYSEIDNLIGFGALGYEQTPGTSVAQGFEMAGSFPVSDSLRLSGAYTYTDSRTAFDTQLVRVPRHELTLGLEADLSDRLSAAFTVSHIAGRADDGFPAQNMPDFTVANATFTYQVSSQAEAYLRIENLFDEEYQTVAGYGTSDRAAFFGIRASF